MLSNDVRVSLLFFILECVYKFFAPLECPWRRRNATISTIRFFFVEACNFLFI